MVQVFIVEDHPVIRQSYALILQREADITICGEADSGEAALLQIPHATPHIVLVDFSLPGMNGLEFVKHLHKIHPTLATIWPRNPKHSGNSLQFRRLGFCIKKTSKIFLYIVINCVI